MEKVHSTVFGQILLEIGVLRANATLNFHLCSDLNIWSLIYWIWNFLQKGRLNESFQETLQEPHFMKTHKQHHVLQYLHISIYIESKGYSSVILVWSILTNREVS